jgi:hypothetical protein
VTTYCSGYAARDNLLHSCTVAKADDGVRFRGSVPQVARPCRHRDAHGDHQRDRVHRAGDLMLVRAWTAST